MIFNNKKPSPFKQFFALLFIIIIVFIPTKKSTYSSIFWNNYEAIATLDLGFSTLHEAIEGSVKSPKNYLNILKKSPDILKNLIFGVDRTNSIDVISIDINFKNLKKLISDRNRALKEGIGHDFIEVNAIIKFKSHSYKAKVGLKGLESDHWRSKIRTSLSVELKEDRTIYGISEFSLHKPASRQFPFDQTFQDLQKQIGNLSPENRFVNLKFNGQDWGIMNLEEKMSKDLLEKQDQDESLIFELGADEYFVYKNMTKKLYSGYRISDQFLDMKIYNSKKYMSDSTYRKWFSYVSKIKNKANPYIYDNDSFTKSLILSVIWNNTHTLQNKNIRYYINPYNLKVYPITTDQGFITEIDTCIINYKPFNLINKTILFKERFNYNYEVVKEAVVHSQSTINYWQSYFPLDRKIKNKTLLENEKKIVDDMNHYLFDENKLFDGLPMNQIDDEVAKYLPKHIYAKHLENGELHLHNLTREDLNIRRICIDNTELNFDNNNIPGRSYSNYEPVIIKTDLKGIFDGRISITTDIYDGKYVRSHDIKYTELVQGINNPLENYTDISSSNYVKNVNGEYIINKGKWIINSPLIIDGNLIINHGAELIFDDDSYLIVKGSLNIFGEPDDKVVFKGKNKYWDGIYVLNSNKKSIFRNVDFFGLNNLSDGILTLKGGLNFYKCLVEISNIKIHESTSESMISFIDSNFSLHNSTFNNSKNTGLFSKRSKGLIQNSSFSLLEGPAVEIINSKISLNKCRIKNIKSSGLLISKKSEVLLENTVLEDLKSGIIINEGSSTSLKSTKFCGILESNIKKFDLDSFYGDSKLSVDDYSMTYLEKYSTSN